MNTTLHDPLKKLTVLVVDDIPGIARAQARELRPHVGKVVVATPDRAPHIISRDNIGLVVTDLRMPNTVIKSGIGLLQHCRRNTPAAVIRTGSISGKFLQRLQNQSLTDRGIPAFRVCLKGDDTSAVLAEMRGALNDVQQLDNSVRQQHIATLSAEISYGDEKQIAMQREIVHEICQHLEVFVKTMTRGIGMLKARCALESWPQWREQGKQIEIQLQTLASYSSDSFLGSIEHTADKLHNIRPLTVLCDIRRIETGDHLNSSQRRFAEKVCAHLAQVYSEFLEQLNASYEKAQKEARGEVTVRDVITEKLGSRICNSTGLKHSDLERMHISDPGGMLGRFFTDLAKAVKADPHGTVDLRYTDPESVIYLPSSKLRDNLKWGSWFQVLVTMPLGYEECKPSWKYLDHLAPHFADIKDRLYVDPRQFNADENAESFDFYVRTSIVDGNALNAEKTRLSKMQITGTEKHHWGYEDVVVTTLSIDGRDAVIINPYEVDPHSPLQSQFSLQIFDGKFIFSGHSIGHTFADGQIYYYLKNILGIERNEAFDVARDSIRGKLLGGREFTLDLGDMPQDHFEELSRYKVPEVMAIMGYSKMQAVRFSPRTSLEWQYIHSDERE